MSLYNPDYGFLNTLKILFYSFKQKYSNAFQQRKLEKIEIQRGQIFQSND